MQIEILSREKVVDEDPINMDLNLERCIIEEDNRIEEAYESQERAKINEDSIKDIREKIIDFITNQGYSYAKGEQEFNDETNDLFASGGTLVEVVITTGIDDKIIEQMMK